MEGSGASGLDLLIVTGIEEDKDKRYAPENEYLKHIMDPIFLDAKFKKLVTKREPLNKFSFYHLRFVENLYFEFPEKDSVAYLSINSKKKAPQFLSAKEHQKFLKIESLKSKGEELTPKQHIIYTKIIKFKQYLNSINKTNSIGFTDPWRCNSEFVGVGIPY